MSASEAIGSSRTESPTKHVPKSNPAANLIPKFEEESIYRMDKRFAFNQHVQAAKATKTYIELCRVVLGHDNVIEGTAENLYDWALENVHTRKNMSDRLLRLIEVHCDKVTKNKTYMFRKHNHLNEDGTPAPCSASKNNCNMGDCLVVSAGTCNSMGCNQACITSFSGTTRNRLEKNRTKFPADFKLPCDKTHWALTALAGAPSVVGEGVSLEDRYAILDFANAWVAIGALPPVAMVNAKWTLIDFLRGGPNGEVIPIYEGNIVASKNFNASIDEQKETENKLLEAKANTFWGSKALSALAVKQKKELSRVRGTLSGEAAEEALAAIMKRAEQSKALREEVAVAEKNFESAKRKVGQRGTSAHNHYSAGAPPAKFHKAEPTTLLQALAVEASPTMKKTPCPTEPSPDNRTNHTRADTRATSLP